MSDRITLNLLVDAAKQAVTDVVACSLSLEATLAEPRRQAIPGLSGSVIMLTSETTRACIGFSSTPEGCRQLAGAMLGMEPADAAELSHDDVRDSVAELVNIVVGAIKTRLVEYDPQLALGLPIYIEGVFEGVSRSETVYLPCRVGEVGCMMTVLVSVDRAA